MVKRKPGWKTPTSNLVMLTEDTCCIWFQQVKTDSNKAVFMLPNLKHKHTKEQGKIIGVREKQLTNHMFPIHEPWYNLFSQISQENFFSAYPWTILICS